MYEEQKEERRMKKTREVEGGCEEEKERETWGGKMITKDKDIEWRRE